VQISFLFGEKEREKNKHLNPRQTSENFCLLSFSCPKKQGEQFPKEAEEEGH